MRRGLNILALALLCVLGFRGLILHGPFEALQSGYFVFASEIKPSWIKPLVWLFAFALPLAFVIDAIMLAPQRRILYLKRDDGGKMMMRQSVVRKIVRQSVAEMPEIEQIDVRASGGSKGLKVNIGIKARAVRSVRELESGVRTRAEESLRSVLGIENIAGIHIQLDDMSSYQRAESEDGSFAGTPSPPPRGKLEGAESQSLSPSETDDNESEDSELGAINVTPLSVANLRTESSDDESENEKEPASEDDDRE